MSLPPDPTATGAVAPAAGGPQPSSAAPADKSPSAAGYWIAGAIIVVGAVVAVIWFVSGISNLFSAVDSYPRFTVPGQISTPLEAHRYKIFAEYPGAMTDSSGVFRVGDVTVVDRAGRSVPVSSSYSEETYSWNGHQGRSIAEFTAPAPGIYTIEATSAATPSGTTVRIAIGRGLQPSALVPLFAAAAVGGVAVLVGIVLIVVTAVRRSRAKRRGQPAVAVAYPPGYAPGYPPAYPPGYGQGHPPGYGPGYPPPSPPGYPPSTGPYPTASPPPGPAPGAQGPWGPPPAPGAPAPPPPPPAPASPGWGAPLAEPRPPGSAPPPTEPPAGPPADPPAAGPPADPS